MPDEFDYNMVNVDPTGGGVILTAEFDGEVADPGQWVTVIPEPATLSLLAIGGFRFARSFRRGGQ